MEKLILSARREMAGVDQPLPEIRSEYDADQLIRSLGWLNATGNLLKYEIARRIDHLAKSKFVKAELVNSKGNITLMSTILQIARTIGIAPKTIWSYYRVYQFFNKEDFINFGAALKGLVPLIEKSSQDKGSDMRAREIIRQTLYNEEKSVDECRRRLEADCGYIADGKRGKDESKISIIRDLQVKFKKLQKGGERIVIINRKRSIGQQGAKILSNFIEQLYDRNEEGVRSEEEKQN